MGGGPRYPYPKDVYSPTGGWWSRPKNWGSNTVVAGFGIFVTTYFLWSYSADREWRHKPPNRWIPSMTWARQFKEGEMGIKEP